MAFLSNAFPFSGKWKRNIITKVLELLYEQPEWFLWALNEDYISRETLELKNSYWESCYIAYGKNFPTYLHPHHKQYIHNLDGKGNEISETYLCYP